jgi:hypothetical protein
MTSRHYDGNSEACCDCKRFYRDGGEIAPCTTCTYRKREEESLHIPEEQEPDGCELNKTCEGCTSQPVFVCSMDVERQKIEAAHAATFAAYEDLWKFCFINGAEEHGDLIGLPKDPFFPRKLLKYIAEKRVERSAFRRHRNELQNTRQYQG